MIHPLISLIVAVAANGVIGSEGGMPWRLSTDSKRFRAITMGKPVVMGRKTWESLGKPLAGRHNIVITRSGEYVASGATVVPSLDSALQLARSEAIAADLDEIFVIGGGEIYRQAMPRADRIYFTRVHAERSGDTVFPEIDPLSWVERSREEVPAGERDDFATSFIVYERAAAPTR